jgi:TonB family protein
VQFQRHIFSQVVAWFLLTLPGATSIANEPIMPVEVPDSYTRDNLLSRWLEPIYPPDALSKGISGDVTIEFDINQFGQILNPSIANSVPPGTFNDAVMRTLDNWIVYPYRAAGCFTEFPRSRVTVSFKIDGAQPSVIASRPLPLTDPAKTRRVSVGEASKATDPATTSNPVKREPLRWISSPRPKKLGKWLGGEGVSADVVAKLTVNPDGNVGEIKVLFSSIPQEFRDTAVDAFKEWKAGTASGEMPSVPDTLCQAIAFRYEPRKYIPIVD